MSRNAGKRPHELLLQIMQVGTTLTPTEIDKHVGNGPYASKHIWFLGKLGFKFDIVKQGRTVVSYTMLSEPANAASIRNPVVATKAVKIAKVKAPKAKTVSVARTRAVPASVKAAASKFMKQREVKNINDVLEAPNAGSIGSFSVDPDWDSMEGIDPANFVR